MGTTIIVGKYTIDEYGNIISNHSKKPKSMKWSINNKGYAHTALSIDNTLHHWLIHRLVATLFIPNPNNLPHVNHKDFDKLNNHVSNLEWTTCLLNNQHYANEAFRKKMGISF